MIYVFTHPLSVFYHNCAFLRNSLIHRFSGKRSYPSVFHEKLLFICFTAKQSDPMCLPGSSLIYLSSAKRCCFLLQLLLKAFLSQQGSCYIYYNKLLADLFLAFSVIGQTVTLLFLILALMFYKKTDSDEQEETADQPVWWWSSKLFGGKTASRKTENIGK